MQSQTTPNLTPTPTGYMTDAMGRLVPVSMVKPIDMLRDQTVRSLVDEAKSARQTLQAFKQRAFADIAAFIEASAEQWEITVGGSKGNVTLRSFDGRYKVERSIQEHIAFDERLHHAKTLIDACITEWATSARPEIQVLVNSAFEVNQEGRVSTQRVLGLQRLNIEHPDWQAAMRAISQSVTVVGSRAYVRVFERVGDTNRYESIVLDVASV